MVGRLRDFILERNGNFSLGGLRKPFWELKVPLGLRFSKFPSWVKGGLGIWSRLNLGNLVGPRFG